MEVATSPTQRDQSNSMVVSPDRQQSGQVLGPFSPHGCRESIIHQAGPQLSTKHTKDITMIPNVGPYLMGQESNHLRNFWAIALANGLHFRLVGRYLIAISCVRPPTVSGRCRTADGPIDKAPSSVGS